MTLKTTTSNEVTNPLPAPATPAGRLLTADQFQRLADVPPEIEWFANLGNKSTRRAYENALQDFMRFTGIVRPDEFRTVTRAHVIAWRDDLAKREPSLSRQTLRHRLTALSSLFEYLCERKAVTHNPESTQPPRIAPARGEPPCGARV
jgi:integrase/recombinase XerD